MLIHCKTFIIIIAFQCQYSNQWDLVVSKNDHEIFKRDINSESVPTIREFLVKTNVANRFAETSVVSRVENADTVAKQTSFSVVLPERAYISGFSMEINGKYYHAYVREKEEAKNMFGQSVAKGQTAAHVAVSARNSNRFTVHINVEPESKVIFHLDYEELLQRENGQYEIVANIQPGQLVKKLVVEVIINETNPLTFIRTPYLRSGSNYLVSHNTNMDPHAKITRIGNSSVVVHFEPDMKRQLEFACNGLGNEKFYGFAGQFVVKYDVERTNEGGETLIQDDFFLYYVAPQNMVPLPKHIVFVLDTSGSMEGQKIVQLKDAMKKIMPQMREEDLFSIVQYDTQVYVWDLDSTKVSAISWTNPENANYGGLEENLLYIDLPNAHTATKENINKAINIIDLLQADQLTNSIGALEVGLYLIKLAQQKHLADKPEPLMVFLTDGLPNVGIISTADIISKTAALNTYNIPIYALSFGQDANWTFLETLSLQNKKGYPIRIQEAEDSSEQLQIFYSRISTPLMTNVSVDNLPSGAQVTQTKFPIYFNGTEMVIAGRGNSSAPLSITGKGRNGTVSFEAKLGIPLARLEKVWAYLTVKQFAEEYHATGDTAVYKKALDLALNYSLVTEFTSLVVVKPDSGSNAVEPEDAIDGFFPMKPEEIHMCGNLPDWMEKNKIEFELETTTELAITTTTIVPTDPDIWIMELDFTDLPTTTETSTTTETPTTTTEKIITCRESAFGCCYDGVTFSPGPNYNGCDPIPRPESCSLKVERGPCKNVTMKWFYNTAEGQCTKFRYGGCDGNGNRFGSKEICESTCINVSGPDRCKLPIQLGSCRRYQLTWFYDSQNDNCRKYQYHGCFGNSNRFSNKRDCLQMCSPEQLNQTIHDWCLQPKDKGYSHCQKYDKKFYYNAEIGQCIEFWFTGCGGNDNRFDNMAECNKLCLPNVRCNAPAMKGPCKGKYKQWYFDVSTNSCQTFIFGGCGGNKNKFNSLSECQSACIGS